MAQNSFKIHEVNHWLHYPQDKLNTPPQFCRPNTNINPTNYGRFSVVPRSWNQFSSQMNQMVEINIFLKKAVQDTYKRLRNVQKQNPKKSPNNMTNKKTDKNVKLVDNKNRNNRDNNKDQKKKIDISSNEKNKN